MRVLRISVIGVCVVLLALSLGVLSARGEVVGMSGTVYVWEREAIEPKVVECGIIRPLPPSAIQRGPILLKSRMYGWVIGIEFDTDQDGRIDAMAYWAPGTHLARWYWFDTNGDEEVDVIFKDVRLDGTCDGIEIDWQARRKGDIPYARQSEKERT